VYQAVRGVGAGGVDGLRLVVVERAEPVRGRDGDGVRREREGGGIEADEAEGCVWSGTACGNGAVVSSVSLARRNGKRWCSRSTTWSSARSRPHGTRASRRGISKGGECGGGGEEEEEVVAATWVKG
jgi:hypothetical protein